MQVRMPGQVESAKCRLIAKVKKAVPRKDGGCFPEHRMSSLFPPSVQVIVHSRKIIMHQRMCMNHLHRCHERFDLPA